VNEVRDEASDDNDVVAENRWRINGEREVVTCAQMGWKAETSEGWEIWICNLRQFEEDKGAKRRKSLMLEY
jgi:hypothetical protein